MAPCLNERPITDPKKGDGAIQHTVVQEHFRDVSTEWSERYKRSARRMSDLDMHLRKENVRRMLDSAMGRHKRPLRLLDLGCGAGNVLEGVSPDQADILGMDIVPEMVAAASRVHPSGHFVVGDAAKLPFAAESVDIVTCIGVLEYLPDAGMALQSIHDSLRPGGHLIVSFPNKTSLFRKLSRLEARVDRLLVSIRDYLRGQSPHGIVSPRYQHTQWSAHEAWSRLRAAGFEIQDAAFNTYGLWGWTGRRAWSLRFSSWMSRRFHRRSWLSKLLACTMVVRARKAHVESQ